jgi:outer membrane receptor protein involved in Fe transport
MSGGEPATLGYFTQNYPNVFFKENGLLESDATSLAFTGRGGFKVAFNENSNAYAGYSRGRRPKVLQFTSTGEEQELDAEIVNSYDFGLKASIYQRIWIDLGAFYHDYKDFQTTAWIADPNTGEYNYIVTDGGKANAYGAEANLKCELVKGIQIFGNYAYIHARFADKDADGVNQAYAGNMFRLTPEHSFAVGVNARIKLMDNLYVFAIPSYVYQTKVYFEDANTPGLEQSGYGLLNLNAGIELPEQKLTLAFWGNNLVNQAYIVSAGNTGSLFGSPTQIPGTPRMFGTKISWNF